RIEDHRPDEGNQLTLAHRKRRTPLHHVVIQLSRETLNELPRTDQFSSMPDHFFSHVVIAQCDIVINGVAKQEYILKYNTNIFAQLSEFILADIDPVNFYNPAVDFIEPV